MEEPRQLQLNRKVLFAIFAIAILFSMIREWNGPVACLRPLWEAHAGVASASH